MGYKVTPEEACLLFTNLMILSETIMVWPNPAELLMGGSKIQCYETLRVASLMQGTSTPLCALVDKEIGKPSFLKRFSEGRCQGVLKRDFSMKAQHVFLPTTPNLTSKIKKSLSEEEETWKRVDGLFGRPRWFVQPYIPHLLYVGEIRCFFAGCRLVYTITTTPGGELDRPCQVTSEGLIRPIHTHS